MNRITTKLLGLLALTVLVSLTGCVTKSSYNALQQQYDQLEAAFSADQAQIVLLPGELKVTMLDNLLFP